MSRTSARHPWGSRHHAGVLRKYELCSHERDWPFEVVNFLELVLAPCLSHGDLCGVGAAR
jgi:hypothetical protein